MKATNEKLQLNFRRIILIITDILCAADYCSMQLRRIDTLNFISEKSQKSPLICPVFGIDGSDFLTFMTFLSIDCPDFYTIGIYRQI